MNTTRRRFLKESALSLGAPLIVPASVLGKGGATAPNDRVQLGCIGVGGMGTGNLNSFLQDPRVEVLGICDVDRKHRERALEIAKLGEAAGTGDFRELLARKDLDAVMIATPDHWHAIITAAAVRQGKDIYCEKPLAASIGEGRFVSNLVRNEKRVLQCGTWRRSSIHTRMACEWVRNGYIGNLRRIEVGVPGEFAIRGGYTGLEAPQLVPEELDYEMWLGPAPEAPYTAARCHFNFRWITDYAPGYITDWGAHFLDVAQWGNGTDDTTPVNIRAEGVERREKGLYNAPESFSISYRYANGVDMTMLATDDKEAWGIKFIGDEDWIFTENSKLVTHPKSLRTTRLKPDDKRLYDSKDHHRNFIDCVYSREETAAPAETAHRAASCCHLGAIAAAIDQEVIFDPKKEVITNAKAGQQRIMRRFCGSWKLG